LLQCVPGAASGPSGSAGPSAAPSAPSTSAASGFDIFKPGNGKHGKLPKKPKDKYKGIFHTMSVKCGLPDKYTFMYVSEYLELNGDYSIVDVSVLFQYRLHALYIDCVYQIISIAWPVFNF
jgi:hypothetical protein